MFTCIRQECIEDPGDAYHYEEHLCFCCGHTFMPTPEMAKEAQCPVCGWYKCPHCDGCKCSLSTNDRDWIEAVHTTYCKDLRAMASVEVDSLPETDNHWVKVGLGLQLRFCKRWAACRLGLCTDNH